MHEFERESKRGGYMEGIAEKTGRGTQCNYVLIEQIK